MPEIHPDDLPWEPGDGGHLEATREARIKSPEPQDE
jgi:hypothetical protein